MKKVKVANIQGTPIYLDTDSERYIVREEEYSSLFDAKNAITRELKEKYEGEFIVKCYDGIGEFTASKKYFSDYDDCWWIQGLLKGKYDKKVGKYTEDQLFPRSKENLNLLQKSREMDDEGWRLIREAKALNDKLRK